MKPCRNLHVNKENENYTVDSFWLSNFETNPHRQSQGFHLDGSSVVCPVSSLKNPVTSGCPKWKTVECLDPRWPRGSAQTSSFECSA